MKQVAKLLVIDHNGMYLLLYRNGHPEFGDDPDLPGGTIEDGEEPLDAMVREVQEEAGIDIETSQVKCLYRGNEYSSRDTEYSLFVETRPTRPSVTVSWEHASFEWLDRQAFLEKAKGAKDGYMQMVYNTVEASH